MGEYDPKKLKEIANHVILFIKFSLQVFYS
mgnify:CR=1 FL=1